MRDIFNLIFSFIGDILGTLDSFMIEGNLSLLVLYCSLIILSVIFTLFTFGIRIPFIDERSLFTFTNRENARNKYVQKEYIGKHTYNGKHTSQYINEMKDI